MKSILRLCLVVLALTFKVSAQTVNRAPHFTPRTGDMSQFSLKENTLVGTPVYQLKGEDPEFSKLHYSISGQYFTVDRLTGVVVLAKPLDREKEDILEVIISITDEPLSNSEPNTISLRREIPIIDYNDNAPVFRGRPYSASVSEDAEIGSLIKVHPEIIVTDQDVGINADVQISCFSGDNLGDTEACQAFTITTEKLGEGQFLAEIYLNKRLDFESRTSFRLGLKAEDAAAENQLSALATVSIDILDVQDQPPLFLNAPYSATVPENTQEGTSIMDIYAKDGDTGDDTRGILITIEGDHLGYFRLSPKGETGKSVLETSSTPLDRENKDVLQDGGVYSFFVKATELINNEIPSDYSVTQVTIVITDTDDHKPTFNQRVFNVSIPENIKIGTSVPGLSIYVEDEDLNVNSRYNLSIRNVYNAENVFKISPAYGEGRTAIAIKVNDGSKLDYETDDSKRSMSFDIIASVDNADITSARINIKLLDTNDNPPIFAEKSYKVNVLEDVEEGFKIADLKATDKDSGTFGNLQYTLTGFGSEFFRTLKNEGGLFVNKPLDYEKQKSYSLTMVARDGGGRISTVDVFVDVLDVNDNAPMFEMQEYSRTIRDGATTFEPQFFVRASDRDGPDQGGGRIMYSIVSDNSISNTGNVFSVDDNSGEIKIFNSVDSMDTPRGQYELVVRATDQGYPPLSNDTHVYIRVGVPGNQRPIFKGNFSPSQSSSDFSYDFTPMNYKASILENSSAGTNVTKVVANDPDGLDQLLVYHLVGGAKDNFVINEKSGLITVSPEARLDLDSNPNHYDVIVTAVDSGTPIPETATTTVYINVIDVNDKPPVFNMTLTSAYVSERTKIGKTVFTVSAMDTDMDSDISYTIIDPIKALSKSGVHLKSTKPYNYKQIFRINEKTGEIILNNTLDYNHASVIILTVKAEDGNAVYNKANQYAVTEITLYVQSYSDNTPQFTNDGWTSTNTKITFNVKEEQPVGSTLFVLKAEDPISGHVVTNFKVINSETDLVQVDPQSGQVLLTKRLDYESLESSELTFTVKATSNDGTKYSTAVIGIQVQNINDNVPEFKVKSYKASILESSKHPEQVMKVEATDMDAVLTEQDKSLGFSKVRYSLVGQNSDLFLIDENTGVIQVAPNKTLDRERQSVLRLDVIASDSAMGAIASRLQTQAALIIDVLDVNDNAPKFERSTYMAVVPENVNIGHNVINMTAEDPDEGLGGEVKYDFLDEGEANGLFHINSLTGEIRTRRTLSGKGRAEPYLLRVGAADGGSLHTDASLVLYIGDVSGNDGIPLIIQPAEDQSAFVSENVTIGSSVFQVIASDPDDPSQPSGKLVYKLQEASADSTAFYIDPNTGLITTRKPLDREKQASYELILVVSDRGEPPQTVTRVLQVNVTDVDDHKPRFLRGVDDHPLMFPIKEELLPGVIVGELAAVDEDIGANGDIDYVIVSGNELGLFNLTRTEDNTAVLRAIGRLDRESAYIHRLVVRCFKKGSHPSMKPYNRLDPADIQAIVQVIDIDDHLPTFSQNNYTLGVRLNVPADTPLLTVRATDEDSASLPIVYSIVNITFKSPIVGSSLNTTGLFAIDENTGEIKLLKSLIHFADGSFRLTVCANNSKDPERKSLVDVQMFVVRDRDLLSFSFRSPPSEVRRALPTFSAQLAPLLQQQGLALHVFDAQVLALQDDTLDFTSTSSCFQLSRGQNALTPSEMQTFLSDALTPQITNLTNVKNGAVVASSTSQLLSRTYEQFHVTGIQPCAPLMSTRKATLTQMGLLGVALFLVLAAVISACSACCLHAKYKRKSKRFLLSRMVHPAASSMGATRLYSEPYYST